MMTRKYLWLVLCSAILLFAACQKAPVLTVTGPTNIELSADGSSGTITFTANRDWTISASDSWVSVSPSSGAATDGQVTVTVRCGANTTYEDRTATVTIRMEELSQAVTVKQPANLGVVLPKQVFDLQSDTKSIDVEVQANVQYSVSTSVDWIRQTGTKGLTSKTLTFSIEENKTYDPREGKITIKPQEGNVQEQVISVKQAQKDALIVEKTSYEMPYGGGEIEIKVESNVSFDVTPNADWIHYTQTKALSGSTVCLKIDENETYSSRQGTVEIKQQNGLLRYTINIIQAGRIAVSSIELNVSELTLLVDDEETLVATVKPDNATDKTVYWTTSDSSVATVDNAGNVKAIAEGKTKITAESGSVSASCFISVRTVPEGAVDLGLGVFWATCNLGASAPEEYGDYFAWGEIEPKEEYSIDTYKWWDSETQSYSKYNKFDFENFLREDDAAYAILGGKWRMPTSSERDDLFLYCKKEWAEQNGVEGYLFTSEINGNCIFFPAAGRRLDDRLENAGTFGYYWCSVCGSIGGGFDFSHLGCSFYFYRSTFNNEPVYSIVKTSEPRYLGFSIRPVYLKNDNLRIL